MKEAYRTQASSLLPTRLNVLPKNKYLGDSNSWKLYIFSLHLELSFLKNPVLCPLDLGHNWDLGILLSNHNETDQDAQRTCYS